MRILFFWPGCKSAFSLGIGVPILQTILKNAGHEVDVFNTSQFHDFPRSTRGLMFKSSGGRDSRPDLVQYKKDFERGRAALIEAIETFKPDVIGLSALYISYEMGMAYLSSVPKKFFLLIGGVHASICPDEVINNPLVDAVCVGEGESMILEFAKRWDSGSSKSLDFSGVPNLFYKDSAGNIQKNETGCFTDLEKVPPLDKDFAEMDIFHFVGKQYRSTIIETSRGCPFECTYCCNKNIMKSAFGKNRAFIRRRKPQTIIRSIRRSKDLLDLELIRFVDENFLSNPIGWLEEFCSLYKKEIALPFTIMTSVNVITEDRIKAIKEAGCVNVNFGLESGNEDYRTKVLNKPLKDKQFLQARRILEDYDIRSNAGVMIGLPGQTHQIVQETICLIRKLRVPISIAFYIPFPGTAMFDDLKAKGWEGLKDDYDNYRAMGEPVYIPETMSKQEIIGISRTMLLYATLPESLWPVVKLCEIETEETNRLLDILELIFAF